MSSAIPREIIQAQEREKMLKRQLATARMELSNAVRARNEARAQLAAAKRSLAYERRMDKIERRLVKLEEKARKR
jgi:hypothetical protein